MISLDDQWMRINNESDNDGNPVTPEFARMARTPGHMIIGRIVRRGNTFTAQRWHFGQFTDIANCQHATVQDAALALEAAMPA